MRCLEDGTALSIKHFILVGSAPRQFFAGCLFVWLIGRLVSCLIGWMVGWLVG